MRSGGAFGAWRLIPLRAKKGVLIGAAMCIQLWRRRLTRDSPAGRRCHAPRIILRHYLVRADSFLEI